MRNKLFKVTSIAAIFAVASANVYIMNDVDLNSNSDLSLLTLENLADAQEANPSEGEKPALQSGRTSKHETPKKVLCTLCGQIMIGCESDGSKTCTPTNCGSPNDRKVVLGDL